MAKIEILNTRPDDWDATVRGDKMFEIRENDRNFQVGDCLVLRKHDPETGYVTDRKGRQLQTKNLIIFEHQDLILQ